MDWSQESQMTTWNFSDYALTASDGVQNEGGYSE